MSYIADLHVHSHYARATSKDLHLCGLATWAQIKGIDVVGTGDFTHPAWYKILQEELVAQGNGFFKLKSRPDTSLYGVGVKAPYRDVHFCLSVEVCCIYHDGGKLRKSHHLICVAELEAAHRLKSALADFGDLAVDGRPILQLSARNLLEIVLETSPRAHLIPAHIWTPWFAILGSRSGYNSLEACFGDLTSHIFALETGLSSDPAMNWRWSDLDKYTMLSNSDAHSPRKLGREANLLDTELTYDAMFHAFKTREGFEGTLEFFPEEGKYYLDGHRHCKVCYTPEQTRRHKGICPLCQKPLTLGVLHRIDALADRGKPLQPPGMPGFTHLIPLEEIISQIRGRGVSTKSVRTLYAKAIQTLGSELDILRKVSLKAIEQKLGPTYAQAIHALRSGEVTRQAGYDGVYGTISLTSRKRPEQGELFV